MGHQSTLKIHCEHPYNMQLIFAALLATAAALPLEDTADVAAAKAEFKAAFAAAEASEHASLAPVNNDVQAAQIGASYLDDTEDVAAAKAAFQAAFDDAAAGGLAAKQEPAPVQDIPMLPFQLLFLIMAVLMLVFPMLVFLMLASLW